MKWECRKRRLGWLGGLTTPEGRYQGHTLERGMEIIDGESRTPWVGWRCQWCGERFQLPGEVARYDLPLMDRVETEELPTEVVEMAAWMLAVTASDDGRGFGHAVDTLLGDGDRWPKWRVPAVCLAFDAFATAERHPFYWNSPGSLLTADVHAEAEALIRTGEVKP